MYKMIKRFLVLTIMLVMATSSFTSLAGSNPPDRRAKFPKQTAEDKAKKLTDTISSVVSLTSEQYPKVYASNLKYLSEKERIKASGGETAKTDILGAIKTRKLEIAAVLTADQKTKWMTWKKARKAQMQDIRDQAKDNKSPQNSGTAPGIPMDDIDGM